jgi:amino acid transporter
MATTTSSTPKLRSGALGFAGAATMGAVMMAPALGSYANFGPLATNAGVVASVIFFFKLSQGQLSFAPFNPGAALNGTTGLFAGMIFGLLNFTGYDVISTLAEETRAPRSLIPRATIAACVGVGVFWIIMSWFYTLAIPIGDLAKYTTFGFTPITPIAQLYWGGFNILVIITAMTAATGVYLATVVGASRVLYAMGREGTLPKFFGQLHPRFQMPWNAMHLIFAVTIVMDVIWALWVGLYNAFSWWGSAIVFFALVTCVFVNLANTLFFWRFRREQFNFFLNLIIPIIAIVVGVYLLYNSFFVSLWNAGWQLGQSIVVASLILLVLTVIYTIWLRTSHPKLFAADAAAPALATEGVDGNE